MRIDLHQIVDLVFLRIVLAEVLLEKVVEADIDVSVVILLEEVSDKPVSDLSVEDEVANQVVLADEG